MNPNAEMSDDNTKRNEKLLFERVKYTRAVDVRKDVHRKRLTECFMHCCRMKDGSIALFIASFTIRLIAAGVVKADGDFCADAIFAQ